MTTGIENLNFMAIIIVHMTYPPVLYQLCDPLYERTRSENRSGDIFESGLSEPKGQEIVKIMFKTAIKTQNLQMEIKRNLQFYLVFFYPYRIRKFVFTNLIFFAAFFFEITY